MVNKFDDDTVGGGGKRGPPGAVGEVEPAGKRGKAGENAGYYAQHFQYSKTKWDVDFEPNFWIDGYDIEKVPFKVLNSLITHMMQLYHRQLKNLQKELIQLRVDIH